MPPSRSVRTDVRGTFMHHLEVGEGPAVVLLHGNPTSSFLWRHVLDRVARPTTPAAAGWRRTWSAWGRSGKPDLAYRFSDHVAHLGAFLEALDLVEDVVLVGTTGESPWRPDRLRSHPGGVRGLAVMEGAPPPAARLGGLRRGRARAVPDGCASPGPGERLALEENVFLDTLLPAALLRPLADATSWRPTARPTPTPSLADPSCSGRARSPSPVSPPTRHQRLDAAAEHLRDHRPPRSCCCTAGPGVLVTPESSPGAAGTSARSRWPTSAVPPATSCPRTGRPRSRTRWSAGSGRWAGPGAPERPVAGRVPARRGGCSLLGRGGHRLPGLQERLEPGQDRHPADLQVRAAVSVAGRPVWTQDRNVTPGMGMNGSTTSNVTVDVGSSATSGAHQPWNVVVSRRPGSTSRISPVMTSPPPAV